MKPFVRCLPTTEAQIQRTLADLRNAGLDANEHNVRVSLGDPTFKNDDYTVVKRHDESGLFHLSIKRNDREPIHDWRDLQEIKNQLCGRECEAVELYPAESRRVDAANQYHLWCMPRPGMKFDFGFNERLVLDTPKEATRFKQRSLREKA